MKKLIFIDTNILLDFYRNPQSDAKIAELKTIEQHQDIIITSEQIEMEFKKHRLNELQKIFKDFINPITDEVTAIEVPPILKSDESATKIKKLSDDVKKEYQVLKDKVVLMVEKPLEHDKAYTTFQALFDKRDSPINLHSQHPSLENIKRLAQDRFWRGCPPRKNEDITIGDSINWEWVLECCSRDKCSVTLLTRDGDYFSKLGKFGLGQLVNEYLSQEFKEKVGEEQKINVTNKFSIAFSDLIDPADKDKIEKEEAELEKLRLINIEAVKQGYYGTITTSDPIKFAKTGTPVQQWLEELEYVKKLLVENPESGGLLNKKAQLESDIDGMIQYKASWFNREILKVPRDRPY